LHACPMQPKSDHQGLFKSKNEKLVFCGLIHLQLALQKI
jgi:hypothetical protein